MHVRLNDVERAALSLRTVGAGRGPHAPVDESRRDFERSRIGLHGVYPAYTVALLLIWVGFPILYGVGLWLCR